MEPLRSAPVIPVAPQTGSANKDTPAKIQRVATEFEALLLAQMLKSAREAGGQTEEGADSSEANSSLIELGEQQFAQVLASSGGLGIAKMVVIGLAKNAD